MKSEFMSVLGVFIVSVDLALASVSPHPSRGGLFVNPLRISEFDEGLGRSGVESSRSLGDLSYSEGMVPLVALFTMTSIDRGEAVAVARKFVADIGLLRIGDLKEAKENGPEWSGRRRNSWNVVFERPAGGWFAVDVDASGKVFRAVGSDFATASRPRSAVEIELGRRLLAKLPNAISMRPSPNEASDTHFALLNGYRIFNLNPTYGYRIDFDPQGRLTFFMREDDLPLPNVSVPTVDRTFAKGRLEDAWTETKPESWPSGCQVRPELGYYKFVGEQQARLVWRGKIVEVFQGREFPLSHVGAVVDATTGEVMEAKDQ